MAETPLNSTNGSPEGRSALSPFPRGLTEGLCLPRLAAFLGLWTFLRLMLLPRAYAGPSSLAAVLAGLPCDLGLAILLSPAPLNARRCGRLPRAIAAGAVFALASFEACAEYFYFDEFGTRFDQVVLDYIFYTGEVTGNVFESYPVPLLTALCVCLGAAAFALNRRLIRTSPGARTPRRLAWMALGAALFAASVFVRPPFADRTTRELARNGAASLTQAAFTGELDYASHYSTMERPLESLRASLAAEPGFEGFTDGGVRRRMDTGRPERRLNLVLVIAESLGRELTARGISDKGEGESFSPRFDALVPEGLLYDRFYATGTRTARALEGALASFPPLPGNAIVRLRSQRPLDSLARVLGARGYTSSFIYGGGLGFDNMRDFLRAAGFPRAVEDAGREVPGVFRTSWGSADEFTLDRTLEELEAARASGKAAFITVLTVSNHRPFLFPEGRVPDARQKKRSGAARYADYALGRFFDGLKAAGAQKDTLVAVIGDHGPRSYTRERMPADAHRVPFFLWGPPDLIPPGTVSPAIGSTMDVAPTLLGLLGGTYEASFFGRDLARIGGRRPMAPMQDKQDVGVRVEGGTGVLGFNANDRFLPLDARDAPLPQDAPGQLSEAEREAVRREAIGLFQSAYELYIGRTAP